jgi:DNA-binding transcriptional LysR family regulator
VTTPFRARHPEVQFTILSRTSVEILAHLENLEIDAGLTYLDNEPLGASQQCRSIMNAIACSLLPMLLLAIVKA